MKINVADFDNNKIIVVDVRGIQKEYYLYSVEDNEVYVSEDDIRKFTNSELWERLYKLWGKAEANATAEPTATIGQGNANEGDANGDMSNMQNGV